MTLCFSVLHNTTVQTSSDVSFLSQKSHGLLLILMTAKDKTRSVNVLGLVRPCQVSVQLMFESNLY